jgi:hypothetical protein
MRQLELVAEMACARDAFIDWRRRSLAAVAAEENAIAARYEAMAPVKPVLALAGEHGAAKSTFSAILRGLCEPNTAPLRALPREERDLFIAARLDFLLVLRIGRRSHGRLQFRGA